VNLRHCLADRRHWLEGWSISLLAHALAVAGGTILVADLQLAPQPEPFRWQVAVIDVSMPKQVGLASPQSIHGPARLSERPSDAASKAPATRQVPRETRKIDSVAVTPAPVEPTRAPHERPTPVQPPHPVQPIDETVQPPVNEVLGQSSQSPESAPVSKPVQTKPAAESSVSITDPRTTEASVATDQPDASAMAGQTVSSTEPQRLDEAMRAVDATANRPTAVGIETSETAQPSVTSSETQTAMVKDQPVQETPSKSDLRWLADALWSRVEQLKRYPYTARLNRWEGKVVLRAVIREDGHLMDLEIARSSGYAILDNDAIEVLKKASPLALQHPLGQPQVVVHIPISYRLQ
jgi:protein TonB